MLETRIKLIAGQLGVALSQVEAVRALLEDGATIPFIARYRKEKTGSLDEVKLAEIRDGLARLEALETRREAILKSLEEQGVLTEELKNAVYGAATLTELEDVYLPYRPKRRTRATIAREKGLEPLAELIMAQEIADPCTEALAFINPEKGVETAGEALAGARDIIAEWMTEDAIVRQIVRRLFFQEGLMESRVARGKEEAGSKYRNYFEWQEPAKRAPSHRVLAMLRGENEGLLKVSIRPDEAKALALIKRRFVKNASPAAEEVATALEDGYARLLAPSIETDIRRQLKERADDEALRVFARNLRDTLMAPPLGQRPVVGIDPGYRTGCKVVALDPQGRLLESAVIFVDQSEARTREAASMVLGMVKRHSAQAVAIGNGTASRETEDFMRSLELPSGTGIVTVNESGASVYSASAVAREEFPDQDITVRGAVSIGRRLQDPLAELVKIDPKAIGVGQYQHDVDQARLRDKLDETVVSCVNQVGVKVNSASPQLLAYVSGLGPALAHSIIGYRSENGPFRNRAELKKVPRLGPKAFEMAAGFLRIEDGENPLDASAVHPESYHLVDRMARDLGCRISDLMHRQELREQIRLENYVSAEHGLPTLEDIIAELARPGRDPRRQFDTVVFDKNIRSLSDLKPGMRLTGIVTNVTNFGAFVDIGVHQDGLVHISEMADKFVKNPADILSVNQKVAVTVVSVDTQRRRIGLSMKTDAAPEG
ncbi:MAG: RNA-binding transcriptional accessory protein [Dehalococcoidaceae bacterium]|nr:RNA-binding transcriptional accessory protein [Dehalococcoidaceae bacterium]